MLLRKRAVQSAVQIENKNDIRRHNQAISINIKQHLTLFISFWYTKITEISGERQTHTKALLTQIPFQYSALVISNSYATFVMYDWRMVLKDPPTLTWVISSITDLATNLQDHLHAGGKLMLGLSICIGLNSPWHVWPKPIQKLCQIVWKIWI